MKRLLFIGADKGLARRVRDLAQPCGLTVFQVKTCIIARRVLDWPAKFDVVIIELHPSVPRLELLSEISDRFPAVPLLAVTENGAWIDAVLARGYGAVATLRKSAVDTDALPRCLRRLISAGSATGTRRHVLERGNRMERV